MYLNIVRGGVPASQCKPGKHASRLAVQQCAIKKNNNPAKQCQNPTILELYTIYTYYSYNSGHLHTLLDLPGPNLRFPRKTSVVRLFLEKEKKCKLEIISIIIIIVILL